MDPDLDLRKLRYFVVVAEELSFRRAAERLHIAQPVLSRQIRALEAELGVRLFDRGPRGTALTPAGTLLLDEAVPLLRRAGAMTRRVAAAAHPQRSLEVGVMPGLLVTKAVTAFRSAHPTTQVRVRTTTWADQTALVTAGEIDVSVAREPCEGAGLEVTRVAVESRLALVPEASPLSRRDQLSVTDLAGMLLLQDPALFPEWLAATSGGLRAQAAAMDHPTTVEAKLESVASGAGFLVLPRSTASFYRRPDVRAVAISDLQPAGIAVVTRTSSDPLVNDLAQCIKELGDGIVAR